VSDLHGRPTALELVEAVTGLVREDLLPVLSGPALHQARIAIRALEVVARELALGPEQEEAHRARLAALGCADDARLAEGIRDGTINLDSDLVSVLRADTIARLLVANPAWLEGSGGEGVGDGEGPASNLPVPDQLGHEAGGPLTADQPGHSDAGSGPEPPGDGVGPDEHGQRQGQQ
jgi:hypothetical protein